MTEEDLSRRFFYTTFLVSAPSSDKNKAEQIEEFARNKQLIVRKNAAKSFISDWKTRWNQCNKTRKYFETRFKNWLDQPLFEHQAVAVVTELHAGRKQRDFQNLSNSQKRRRTAELRKEDSEALTFATSSSLRKDGNLDAAKLIQEAVVSPTRAGKILSAYRNKKKENVAGRMSGDQALAIAMDCGLSTHQYLMLRKNSKKLGADLDPNYHKLLEAKARCYPEKIIVTESEAVVNLQCLVNHTANRLISNLTMSTIPEKMCIYYKWGFDGSSGHAEFKQLFESNSASDSSVVITTLVPVRMVSEINNSVVWENPTTSSTRYCRPIRIAYEKECTDSIKHEYSRVQAEIISLTPSKVTWDDTTVTVQHRLFITMIDGKTINAIEGNKATSRCYICKCGPSEMNDLTNQKSRLDYEDRNELQYGISPLHARIKCFEFLLQISYTINLPENYRKKGARKTAESKKALEDRKEEIQDKFRRQLGIIVDMPKPGFGSSNDGNTARKFFENTRISSEITGVDESLIDRFKIILTAMNTSQQVDPEKFAKYSNETAKILVKKYNWWSMSPTVHKILVHGADIMSHAILPLGQLSEEALEHRNKDFKNFRSQFARRNSRLSNLTDVFNRFLCSSDPVITHLRASTKMVTPKRDLPGEVRQLLKSSEDKDLSSDMEAEIDEGGSEDQTGDELI